MKKLKLSLAQILTLLIIILLGSLVSCQQKTFVCPVAKKSYNKPLYKQTFLKDGKTVKHKNFQFKARR